MSPLILVAMTHCLHTIHWPQVYYHICEFISLALMQRVVGHMDKTFPKHDTWKKYYFSHGAGKKELKNRVEFQVMKPDMVAGIM